MGISFNVLFFLFAFIQLTITVLAFGGIYRPKFDLLVNMNESQFFWLYCHYRTEFYFHINASTAICSIQFRQLAMPTDSCQGYPNFSATPTATTVTTTAAPTKWIIA